MSTTEIENILRRAPQPKPPGNLQQRLRAQALSAPRMASTILAARPNSGSWLARWWPALAPTVVSLACAATLTVQQNELRHLRAEMQPKTPAEATGVRSAGSSGNALIPQTTVDSNLDELARLRSLVAALKNEISQLEQVQSENDQLRAQLASRSSGVFTDDETKALDEARDRALSIQCVNNMKQLGLATRVWAIDHKDMSPPDVLSMSNEIGSFKILVCPADTGRQPAADASSFTPANCSYEFLAPLAPDTEPQRILFRCPIHGNIGLIDGSVQRDIVKSHPNWIVQRDGKLFFEASQSPPDPNSGRPEGVNRSQ